jgi:hypothetical protein
MTQDKKPSLLETQLNPVKEGVFLPYREIADGSTKLLGIPVTTAQVRTELLGGDSEGYRQFHEKLATAYPEVEEGDITGWLADCGLPPEQVDAVSEYVLAID